ncbi:hypothetical protein C0J52_13110 [Blattella germanica]|nr:hypothetical protein C0J52_13110 [Blattella germanica]
MQQDICGANSVGLCPDLFPFNGSLFKNYLLNVTFTYGEDDELVEFDRRGDPPGRAIHGAPPRTHCKPLFIKLGILTLPSMYVLASLLHDKRNINQLVSCNSIQQYPTPRNCSNIYINRCKYSLTQNSFNIISLKLFNVLSTQVRELPFATFRGRVRAALVNNPLYAIEEFGSKLPNGSFDYVRIGDWNNGTLIMRDDELQWPRTGERVESVCSRPCKSGFYKNFQTGGQEQKCCWVCVACAINEFLLV